MTLTVEYSEMTATNVEHFKITATASANWVIPARTQEEYKQKKKFSPRPHAHSHAFRHIRTLTYLTVSTHAYLHSSHTSWKKKKKKNLVHALRLKKKIQCKTSFYLKREWERYQWSRKSRSVKATVAPTTRGAHGYYHDGFTTPDYRRPRVSVEWQIWSNDW